MLALRRLAYRLAYRARLLSRRVWRRGRQGVKGVVMCEGELLLVRHTYGSELWELPGGGVRRGEDPLAALRRELREELGITVSDAVLIETLRGGRPERRHRTHVYRVELAARSLRPNQGEIAAVRWCDPAAPGGGLSHSARRQLGKLAPA